MIRTLLIPAILLLSACNQQPAEQESAEDFAARVGGGGTSAEGAPAPVETVAAQTAPPAGANALELEKLGNVSGVDLGPRAGGCTFASNGTEMLMAAAPADRALPGKATVRIGGELLLLDAPPGGVSTVMQGTTFTGEGFTASVDKTGRETGVLTVTNANGQQKAFDGRWVCG